MTEDVFRDKLSLYMPEKACVVAFRWLTTHPARLKITKPRASKLGDFRSNGRGSLPTISVNGNLNPYSFSITLAHEVAHLIDYKNRRNLRNPHGDHWKRIYAQLLAELMRAHVFPKDLHPVLKRHINSPKAASCSDPDLLRELRRYDKHKTTLLEELEENALFRLFNGQTFKKGALKRTRFRCKDTKSGRYYMISGQCEVEPVSDRQ